MSAQHVVIRFTALCTLLAGAVQAQTPGARQTYPARSVQVIVGFPAGGSVDVMARHLIASLNSQLGQQFVVVNRDGASGTIGFAAVANAKPDGYLIGAGPTTPISNAPHLMKGIPYTVDSFEYVCQAFENVFALAVQAESPYRSLQELIAAARANPGKLSYGHSGVGTVPHFAIANFAQRVNIDVTPVAYRGEAPLLPDLLAGRLDFSGTAIASMVGRNIRPLVVFADQRHPAFADVPTSAELGIASLAPGLNGLFAPKGTPNDILQTLERACETATKSETYRSAARTLHQSVVFLNRAAFAKRTAEDYRVKAELVKTLKISAE
jgi:tripartite-type tricarboxylate transporter receptor subunit TctC